MYTEFYSPLGLITALRIQIMDQIKFSGSVVNGIGRHVELFVPGSGSVEKAPMDWPERLCPGSLNVRISRYPELFTERGLALTTKTLDVAGFQPAFTIPQAVLGNNQLKATLAMPHRGQGQVWRAVLEVSGRNMPCWVLRRFGSGLADQLELVSHKKMRDELQLTRDKEWPAVVTVFGQWKD